MDYDRALYARHQRLHPHRRHRPPIVARRFESVGRGDVVMSAVTFGELFFGVAKSPHRDNVLAALDRLKALIPILPIGEDAAGVTVAFAQTCRSGEC